MHQESSPTWSTIQDPTAVLTPLLQYQFSVLRSSLRDPQHQDNRKSHTHHGSTSSYIHLSNPAPKNREMAQSRIAARSTRKSGRGAISRSIRRTDAGATVVVTGGRVISGIHSGLEDMTGGSQGWYACWGFGRRGWACGGEGAGDLELGGVVDFAVSIVSCSKLLCAGK